MESPVKTGFHRLEIKKTTWDVPEQYIALKAVGSGAYGTVCSAIDQQTKEKVAIKKLYRPFQSLIHAQRAYRELRLLRHIQHDNVISLLNVFTPDVSLEKFHTFYMVMPFVAQDLGRIMKSRRLTDRIIVYLFYQLLRGLKYIHSAGIIHRDLKPGNLAVNENCELKILDFGLARHAESEMTGYVVTRWYRSPEVIFNWMHYSQSVDLWSAGCILAEMITGQVLFPGNDSILSCFLLTPIFCTPLLCILLMYVSCSYLMCSLSFCSCTRDNTNHVADCSLISNMLLLDPQTRMTAQEGLSHPYLAEFHDPESEPDSPTYDDSFESLELDVGEWSSLIHMEIMAFDPSNPSATAL
uniref:mitogen-activated protein kinase n=1 Tax=Salmo trutta TaxID=8032 RepID=A0A674E2I7_SALTR